MKELLKRIASDTTGGIVEEDKPLMESGAFAMEVNMGVKCSYRGQNNELYIPLCLSSYFSILQTCRGMDSLSAVEFRNRLSSELPSLDLPNTWLGLQLIVAAGVRVQSRYRKTLNPFLRITLMIWGSTAPRYLKADL